MRESISFERGKDPKEAMDVGILSNAEWDYEVDGFETEDYIYKGFPVRVVGKYWHERSAYPEYAAFSTGGVTGFDYNNLKWYKRKGYAKRHIQNIIDEIIWIRNMAKSKETNESVNFERGQQPKDAMGLGYDPKVVEFLEWVKTDSQLDKSSDNYYGYVNLAEDDFTDRKFKGPFVKFVNDYERYLSLMKGMGLYMTSDPWYDETIIYDDSVLEKNRNHILERYGFERGVDPKKAMDIGQQAALKQEAARIVWDWSPDDSADEEIIWLTKVLGHNVKVAMMKPNPYIDPSAPEEVQDEVYYAVSDSGEPYMDTPTFYVTPREALDAEGEYLAELSEPDASDHEIII